MPKINFDTEILKIPVEIQVTTELQDAIRRMLHIYYEKRRTAPPTSPSEWQWDYSDEFATNNLAHLIHYAEGLMVSLRDKHKGTRI